MYAWELMRDAFTEIGSMQFGTETAGGSSTVLTDTTLSMTADGLIGGTAFVLSADGAAPEGEYYKITDNTATTITLATLSAPIASGDVWGYISKEFKTESLLHLVNIGLDYIGQIGAQDTSITTADSQTEYTFPLTLKAGKIMGVYLQTNTSDANDNRWYPLNEWHVIPNVGGTTATLVLPQMASGHTILIEYVGLHPDVTAFDDFIHESIHPELAKAAFILALQNRRAEQAIGSQDSFNLLYNKARDTLDSMLIKHPVWKPDSKPRRLRIYEPRARGYNDSEPNRVRL